MLRSVGDVVILSVLVLDVRCCDDCDDSEMRAMSDESRYLGSAVQLLLFPSLGLVEDCTILRTPGPFPEARGLCYLRPQAPENFTRGKFHFEGLLHPGLRPGSRISTLTSTDIKKHTSIGTCM